MSSLFIVLAVLIFLLIPTMIAYSKRKRNKIAILALSIINLLVFFFMLWAAADGGTDIMGICLIINLVIWVVLLIWSLLYERPIDTV